MLGPVTWNKQSIRKAVIWLARKIGPHAIGITLCGHQARRASREAANRHVADRTRFLVMDFLATGFTDGSFSKIFASESACYASSKEAFAREAYRLLSVRGRLVVVDGFLETADPEPTDRVLYDVWREGWAVASLSTVCQFRDALVAAGFRNVRYRDLTRFVKTSSYLLFVCGVFGWPALRLLSLARAQSLLHANNALSSIYQRWLFQRKVTRYGIFTCDK